MICDIIVTNLNWQYLDRLWQQSIFSVKPLHRRKCFDFVYQTCDLAPATLLGQPFSHGNKICLPLLASVCSSIRQMVGQRFKRDVCVRSGFFVELSWVVFDIFISVSPNGENMRRQRSQEKCAFYRIRTKAGSKYEHFCFDLSKMNDHGKEF